MLDAELVPLSGDPVALADRARDAARSTAALDDAHDVLRRVATALEGQAGEAVRAARHRLTSAAERLATCAGVLGATSSALRHHADALADAQQEAARALAERSAAVVREHRWQAELDEARCSTWNTGGLATSPALGGAITDSAVHLRALAAERGLATARADIAAAEGRWRRARDTKTDASRRTAAVLVSLGDVRALRAARDLGLSVPGYQASAAQARQAHTVLVAAATGTGAARAARREQLVALLRSHRDDPAFWAVFWDAATPRQLFLALGTAGSPFPAPASSLATTLRSGVEQWAGTASVQELTTFGREVIEGIGEQPLGLTERSEVAAGLLSPALPTAVFAGAGDALDAYRDRLGPATGRGSLDDARIAAIAPAAIAVLAGYARHPRLALDRLAPAGAGQAERAARRWLGTPVRGGWPDGGTAVTGAFAAAVREGTTSPGLGDQRRAASLVSHATTQMPSGLLAGTALSDQASAQVAMAYLPYLPSMGDAAEAQSLNRTCFEPAPAPPPAPGVDDDLSLAPGTGLTAPTVQPTLDAFALREVITASSRTPRSADVWLGATDLYVDQMIDLATSGDHDVDTGPRTSLVRETLSDVGAVTGAMQSETISTARHRVELRENLVTLAGTGLGMATVARGTVESALATAGSAGLSALETDAPLHEAYARVANQKEELLGQYAPRLHDAVVEHDLDLGFTPDEAARRAESIDPAPRHGQFRRDFDATFDDLSQAPGAQECG